MAIELPNEITRQQKLVNPGNLDFWYGPYNSTALAIASVAADIRPGKTVGINTANGIEEYWWKNGVDLVLKSTTGTGTVAESGAPYTNAQYLALPSDQPYTNAQYLAL